MSAGELERLRSSIVSLGGAGSLCVKASLMTTCGMPASPSPAPGEPPSAPLARQLAARVEHESAALYAAHLAPVHVFHFDDAEQLARRFFRVGQEFEREAHFRLEAFVRFQAVARDAEDRALEFLELRVEVAEILALGSAAWRVVFGVEVDDDRVAALLEKLKGLVAGCREFKISKRLLGHRRLW